MRHDGGVNCVTPLRTFVICTGCDFRILPRLIWLSYGMFYSVVSRLLTDVSEEPVSSSKTTLMFNRVHNVFSSPVLQDSHVKEYEVNEAIRLFGRDNKCL